MKKNPKEWGVSELLSAGAVLLTVGGVAIGIRSVPTGRLPPYVEVLGSNALIVLTVGLGLLLVLAALCIACFERLREPGLALRLRRPTHEYYLVTAGTQDLHELYEHYVSLFGNDIVPIDQMASWMKKNAEIAWKVLRIPKSGAGSNSSAELVGFST